MNLLIIDQFDCGFAMDLAIKSSAHGHSVRVYMRKRTVMAWKNALRRLLTGNPVWTGLT